MLLIYFITMTIPYDQLPIACTHAKLENYNNIVFYSAIGGEQGKGG